MPPPINLQYEPTPFLQVAGSWWGQRRQMAHQVAVQQDQSALQHTAQANQMFQSGMTGARQGAAAYQQAQQFDASLAQQGQQFEVQNQRLYDTAYLRNFGQTADQLNASREFEITNGTIPAGTTAGQYQRQIEIERNKLANEPAFARQQYSHWTRMTGLPPDVLEANWTAAGGAETGFGTWQEQARAIGDQRQAQQAQAQQAMAVQAEEQGRILRAAQNQPATSETGQALARFREAEVIASAAQQGHGIPDGQTLAGWRKTTQATAKEAWGDVRNALVKTQPDPEQMQRDHENQSQHINVVDPTTGKTVATITTVRNRDGEYKTYQTTMPDTGGTDTGKMDPVYKWAFDLAMKGDDVYDPDTGELDKGKVDKLVEENLGAYERYRQSQKQPAGQLPELAQLLGQYGKKQDEQQGLAQQRARAEGAMAESTIARLRAKQKTGQPLTREERQAFEQAYNYLHPERAETPQPTPAQDPAVDEARQVIRQLLAKRQTGEQLTPEEHQVLKAARDVLDRATQQ